MEYGIQIRPGMFAIRLSDIESIADIQYLEIKGCRVPLSEQKTGFGIRKFLECPNCHKRGTLLYFKERSKSFFCDNCNPMLKKKYKSRTDLNDQAPTELIDYKLTHLQRKLQPDFCFNYRDTFDYSRYDKLRPKGMHIKTYRNIIARFQLLYRLKYRAIVEKRSFTANEIKDELSDFSVSLFWLFQEEAQQAD